MNYLGKIMSIWLMVMCITVFASALPEHTGLTEMQANTPDSTEGGNLETDLDAYFMAEWWYLNGNAKLVANDGEKKDIGFFVVFAHQESPLINIIFGDPEIPDIDLSHLLTFSGLYFDDGKTNFYFDQTWTLQEEVGDYIALGTPYVAYLYPDPDSLKKLEGSALSGYNLDYMTDDMEMDLFFQTNVDKTIDEADQPLDFTSYEHSYGTLHGSMVIDDKTYHVTRGEGYMDHMIPMTSDEGETWAMDMHGWSWSEVTTDNYQTVFYAVRSLEDGYDDYSYKHLTLLNRHNGKVIAEYSDDEIKIKETKWVDETEYSRKRPSRVKLSAPDLTVTVNAESVVDYDQSIYLFGFVDFMAFQPDEAVIKYEGDKEEGSAFYEYLVTDMGVSTT